MFMLCKRKRIATLFVLMLFVVHNIILVTSVSAQDTCQVSVASQPQLIDAINNANTNCPNGTTITLIATIETIIGEFSDDYNQGLNAFPVITSTIRINGGRFMIVRGTQFLDRHYRFFSVGGNGNLTLDNITLSGGGVVNKGGAILVHAIGGNATLNVINSTFYGNTASNDGGAIQITGVDGFVTTVDIENTLFSHNNGGPNNLSEGEGGAIFTDGRAGAELYVTLSGSEFSNNVAGKQAGALHFLTVSSNTIFLTIENNDIFNNSGPQCFFQGPVIVNGSNRATDNSCGNAIIVETCILQAASVQELIDTMNRANDEVLCPGEDTITLINDLQPTSGLSDGQTAFPNVTSSIVIEGNNHTISRDSQAPAFRFFFVDGRENNKGHLTLHNLTLTGGSASGGGAIMIDATSGNAMFGSDNVIFSNNSAPGENGGAIMLLTLYGGQAGAVIRNSQFIGNQAAYGGAFYNGAFDNGSVTALIVNTTFANNSTSGNGGAIYNNGQGSGFAQLTLENSTLNNNSAGGTGGAIMTDGTRAGRVNVVLNTTIFSGNISTQATGDAIYSISTDGASSVVWNAAITTESGGFDGNLPGCFTDDAGYIQKFDCPQ